MLMCKDVVERASEYLDQDLTTMQRLRFKMHLMMCRHCRRFMQHLGITQDTSARVAEQQASKQTTDDQVVERVMAHIEKNLSQARKDS